VPAIPRPRHRPFELQQIDLQKLTEEPFVVVEDRRGSSTSLVEGFPSTAWTFPGAGAKLFTLKYIGILILPIYFFIYSLFIFIIQFLIYSKK
jgi:hypothetical protein